MPSVSQAEDVSAPAILQWFDATYRTQERRAADLFRAGYGSVWLPPPGRADSGNQSVGYDPYDRFDLGVAGSPTLYGTATGLKRTVSTLHRAGADVHVDFVINHNGFRDSSSPGFVAGGDYPGFVTTLPNDVDGDFHGAFQGGDHEGRLSGLIDIDHDKNHFFIRHPVTPGDPRNIPGGQWADQAKTSNRQFYPDRDGSYISVFDPTTGEQNIRVYRFNTANPMAGDAVEENATGLLMRNAQWLVQTVGVDGFRVDAAKHVQQWVMNYLDRAVYRASDRTLLDGSQRHVFSYSEVFDADRGLQQSYIRKDINPNDPGRIGGNRDVLDFPQFFALRDNLTGNGFANDWRNVVNAGMDVWDDGKKNGSAGVLFASSHDKGTGAELNNVAHAYMLMQPGNAVVYFNAKEHGQDRDFPKDGRGDALGGHYGEAITKLVTLRNTHGRGNYRERYLDKELHAYERSGSALVLLSNRTDSGFDSRTLNVDLPFGTYLVEMTGNAANPQFDPNNDIPEVIQVTNDFFNGPSKVNVRFLRNSSSGQFHGNGYLVYGLPTPQGNLSISNVAQTLAPETPTAQTNGSARLSAISVIKTDTFDLTLNTNAVNLLGTIRDRSADGDNAVFSIDGGVDANGNGRVDYVAPGSVVYGFEEFTGTRRPGYFQADGNGLYAQSIDATKLSEGYHFVEVRAFRQRSDGGPAVYTPFKQTIYVDRLKPVSEATDESFRPYSQWVNGQTVHYAGDNDVWVTSTDGTADSVHVFLNLPANLTETQIRAMVNAGQGRAEQIDRDVFKTGFAGIPNGNNTLTVVTFEITGNSNVQRLTGLTPASARGAGLADLNHDGAVATGDLAGTNYGFEHVLYARNSQFNPAADLTADGRIDNRDLFALRAHLAAVGAGNDVRTTLEQIIRNRGNINRQFGTDAWDIDAMYDRALGRVASSDLWYDDLNADGSISKADVDALVRNVFDTFYGDANLDGAVDFADLGILLNNYNVGTGGWAVGNFDGTSGVDFADLGILLNNYNVGRTGVRGGDLASDPQAMALLAEHGFTTVPEPATLATLAAAPLLLARRRRRSVGVPIDPRECN